MIGLCMLEIKVGMNICNAKAQKNKSEQDENTFEVDEEY